jgi:hypothetical protein
VRVTGIDWDATNQAHFAEHGRASREQVEDVVLGRYHPARAGLEGTVRGEARFRFEGETRLGRFLVVIASQRPGGIWRPVTCWPLSGTRLESYRAWRRTVRR